MLSALVLYGTSSGAVPVIVILRLCALATAVVTMRLGAAAVLAPSKAAATRFAAEVCAFSRRWAAAGTAAVAAKILAVACCAAAAAGAAGPAVAVALQVAAAVGLAFWYAGPSGASARRRLPLLAAILLCFAGGADALADATAVTKQVGDTIAFTMTAANSHLCYTSKAGTSPATAVCAAAGTGSGPSAASDTPVCTAAGTQVGETLVWGDATLTKVSVIECANGGSTAIGIAEETTVILLLYAWDFTGAITSGATTTHDGSLATAVDVPYTDPLSNGFVIELEVNPEQTSTSSNSLCCWPMLGRIDAADNDNSKAFIDIQLYRSNSALNVFMGGGGSNSQTYLVNSGQYTVAHGVWSPSGVALSGALVRA